MRVVRRKDECAYIIREGYPETTGMTRMLEVRRNVIYRQEEKQKNRLP